MDHQIINSTIVLMLLTQNLRTKILYMPLRNIKPIQLQYPSKITLQI